MPSSHEYIDIESQTICSTIFPADTLLVDSLAQDDDSVSSDSSMQTVDFDDESAAAEDYMPPDLECISTCSASSLLEEACPLISSKGYASPSDTVSSSSSSSASSPRASSSADSDKKHAPQSEQAPPRPEQAPTIQTTYWMNFYKWADDYVRRKLQYVYLFVMLYAIPITTAMLLPLAWVSFLYFFGLACVAFVNGWMICEAVASIGYTRKQRKLHRSKPEIVGQRQLGAIVAAYLPNELTVLCDTVKAISAQIHCLPQGTTLDIVIAHNGGKLEQRCALLEDLRKIECEIPDNVRVHELNVVRSTSKAMNVNSALAFFREMSEDRGSEFTQLAMYDADHQPIPEAYLYALETMQDQKADMVMGRCCVQDGYKFIAVEFDILYAVAHAGGRCIRGFGFFGGSNGYWDYKTLQETGMDETMLTEDVDSSFRAQAAGHTMTYDPTIVSFEEAPPSLQALFKQRLRWSQGWAEVTWRQRTLWFRKAPGLTLWSRFCIFLILPFREAYLYLSSFTVPIAIVSLSRTCGVACTDPRLLAFFFFCLLVPIYMAIVASILTLDREKKVHYRLQTLEFKDYIHYILISYGYEFAKIHWAVLGHARNFLGLNKWVVTKRRSTKGEEQAVYEPRVIPIDRPESLVEDSPYAPATRRLFSRCFV